MPELRKLLTDARALIEEHGWIQFDHGNSNRGYCLVGALVVAGGSSLDSSNNIARAQRRLLQLTDTMFLTHWNDAEGRTQDEVLELLRRALDE